MTHKNSSLQAQQFLLPAMFFFLAGCTHSEPRVVLYSAQDQEFAEKILPDFTRDTGFRVDTKYDTEATKSVNLYTELVNEKARPRCDVHWNNEILATIRLQRQGLYQPYDSPAASPYPASAKAADKTWYAFAARARIIIVNTELLPTEAERPKSLLDLADPRWKGKIAMAKPQFGTTATQAACLFEVLGAEKAKDFYKGLEKNQAQLVSGNKQVAEGVGAKQYAVGLTDTDDAMDEVDKGHPVAIIFPDRDGSKEYPRLGTLFLPNTVAVVRDCPNPQGAHKLIDFLLSSKVEKELAESESHQIPLNPQVEASLPKEIERPDNAGGTVKSMKVDFEKAADLWDEAQAFLREMFARPQS